MAKTTKIRQSAQGENCTVRIEGICSGRTDTTVLAHLNGGGMALKQPDYLGCYACASCHSWLDSGYIQTSSTRQLRDFYHYQAIIRTLPILFEKGLIGLAERKQKTRKAPPEKKPAPTNNKIVPRFVTENGEHAI